jgi:undecaprenyl diphosphate synthase
MPGSPATPASLHVAIILDGNGRWAAERGLPRSAGYRAGAEAVRRVVEAAPVLCVDPLTLYVFSSDNWERPASEIRVLLRVVEEFLREQANSSHAMRPRIRVIGRRDRLPTSLREAIDAAEAATAEGGTFELRLALDYSARDAILRAACRMYTATEITREAFARLLESVNADGGVSPDVDLLIRTGGEQRLSDFLLWESAYAELYFTPRLWPDFDAADLALAIAEYRRRDRRFGRVPAAAVS